MLSLALMIYFTMSYITKSLKMQTRFLYINCTQKARHYTIRSSSFCFSSLSESELHQQLNTVKQRVTFSVRTSASLTASATTGYFYIDTKSQTHLHTLQKINIIHTNIIYSRTHISTQLQHGTLTPSILVFSSTGPWVVAWLHGEDTKSPQTSCLNQSLVFLSPVKQLEFTYVMTKLSQV